jgi:hypothetical protein
MLFYKYHKYEQHVTRRRYLYLKIITSKLLIVVNKTYRVAKYKRKE